MSQKNEFCTWLLSMIEQKGIKQADLARGVGVSRTTVSGWCSGAIANVTEQNKKKIYEFFGGHFESDDDSSVVVSRQLETRVFINQSGGISISQSCWPEEDFVISFRAEYADAICSAIKNLSNQIIKG